MRKYIYLPILLLLLCRASAYGQFEREIAAIKEHSKQFMGQWGIANDTLTFTVVITPCARIYPDNEPSIRYEGFIGRFQCRYTHGDSTLTSEGEVTDWYQPDHTLLIGLKVKPNRASFLFRDKITGNVTGGSIEVGGDILLWNLAGHERVYLVDENGKPIGYQRPPEKYSIPRRMKLIRIKP